ncbi:MAG: hypothetical protein ACJ8HJ_09660 [Massilia sp.]
MSLGSQEEYNWGANANCYAFACNSAAPAVGHPPRTARPGVAGGQPVQNNGNVVQLVAGVLADGGHLVQRLGGDPSALPIVPANSYLVAMLTNAGGFHFMKRDELTRRWSWKDANHGSVKLNVMHFPTDHYVYVNDANLNDILVTHRGNYVWAYNQMTFQTFFAVVNGGFPVAG